MKNQELPLSGRTMSKPIDMLDIITKMYFKIEDMKKARVKTVRSYFRKMRRKAGLRSKPSQPSNYTASTKDSQIEALLIQSEGDMR